MKLIVTLAPAGTVIVLLSKAIFWAVRLIVTGVPPAEVVVELVGVVVILEVVVAAATLTVIFCTTGGLSGV